MLADAARMSFPTAFLLLGDTGAAGIPLALFLVFVSAKLMAEIFERLGQPGIVGEILAGVLIGPGVLGWLAPNDLLSALADLGAMFLLFRVGLEVKSSELMRVGGTATLVAFLGVAAPFALGWAILLLWGESGKEAAFVGAAMTATSVGITAQVLASRRLLHYISSQIVLAAAVIDDVLGLLVLAMVSSLARGTVNVMELALTALLAIAFTLIVAKWGTDTLGRVAPRVGQQLRLAEAHFALSMGLMFGLALLAVYAGVAAIVGAFLAGMALAETTGQRVRDLTHGVTELLVPFFLAGIGLHVDLSPFANPANALLAGVIVLAAVASKFIGCGLAALRLGRQNALRVGVGMIPRGEVGMVVAQIGLAYGIIQQSIYGVVVLMSIVTTMLAPPLIKLAHRGLSRAEGEEEEEQFRLG